MILAYGGIRWALNVTCSRSYVDGIAVQVIQTGQYLIGNLGDERTRSFNVAGPLQTVIQRLLPLAHPGRREVLVMQKEYETAVYEFNCIPYDLLNLNGQRRTVFCVLASAANNAHEWMYQVLHLRGRAQCCASATAIPSSPQQVDVLWQASLIQ